MGQFFLTEVARQPQLPDSLAEGEKVRITFHPLDLRPSFALIYTLSV